MKKNNFTHEIVYIDGTKEIITDNDFFVIFNEETEVIKISGTTEECADKKSKRKKIKNSC